MIGHEALAPILARIPGAPSGVGRFVVAIAGPPAAGKSTLTASLLEALGGRAGVVAMDGFHFDNDILDARGHRDRKGAPHTFDVTAFGTILGALGADRSVEMAVPVYDRGMSMAQNCATWISRDNDVLVTEGNYLLLDEQPWSGLRSLFDLTIWIDVPLSTVESRIIDRWSAAQLPSEEIRRRTEDNDLPNARLVHTGSVAADIVVSA